MTHEVTVQKVLRRTRSLGHTDDYALPLIVGDDQAKQLKKKNTREKFIAPIAGFTAAALEISTMWPFEYAKTQLQLNRTNKSFDIVQHVRSEGLNIYKGLAPMLIGAPIQGLLRFSTLDYFTRTFKDPTTGKVSVASGLAAGICAGILESVIIVTPMETVKTRLIDSGKGLVQGVTYVVQNHGISGLYKGVGATIAKSASNQGFRFIIFNQYQNMILDNPLEQKLTSFQSLAGGMIAGLLGALGNTPFDTIKSRMQSLEASRYHSLFHCASTMVKEEGYLSLYKGLIPRCMRVVPGQGIIFMSYSQISGFLRDKL